MKKRCKNPHAVALQVRWLSPERGQETGQTRKRPQAGLVKSRKKRIAARRNAGRLKPRRRRNKRSSRFAAPFGYRDIGSGYGAIRSSARALC